MLNNYSENTVLLDRKEARTARIQKIFQMSSKEEMAAQLLEEYHMVFRGEKGSSVLFLKNERLAVQAFLSTIMEKIMNDMKEIMNDPVFSNTIAQHKQDRMNIDYWFQENKEKSLVKKSLKIHDSVSYDELQEAMQDFVIKQEIAYIDQLLLEEQPFTVFQTLIEKAEQGIEEIKEVQLSKLLCSAVKEDKVEELKSLLEEGAIVNQADEDGKTPLLVASEEGHVEIVKILLENGAVVDKADKFEKTPLYTASQKGHVEVVKILLEKGAALDKADNEGTTPLWIASQKGHLEIVKSLLEKGAAVDKADDEGEAPLWIASGKGHLEIVKSLLEKGAAVDKVENYHKATPLWNASRYGQVEIVKILLENGAVVDKADKVGKTPLWIASKEGYVETVKSLLEKGAAVDRADSYGVTPLCIASMDGHVAVIQKLLEIAGKDISGKDKGSALLCAVFYSQEAAVQALLSCCGKDIKSEDKLSALEDAKRRGGLEIAKKLLKEHLEEENLLQSTQKVRLR